MILFDNFPLVKYNTFGIYAWAKLFALIQDEDDLLELIGRKKFQNKKRLILGGGSNVLFRQNFEGLILKNNMRGIEVQKETDDHVWVSCKGGENWHEFVLHCIRRGWGGIENLSLIPGSVGAAPIQNIGAYGVEIKDVFDSLTAIHLETSEKEEFNKKDCQFGYRNSIFKNELKGQYCITEIVLKLNKKPVFNLDYGSIKKSVDEVLSKDKNKELSIKLVSDVVCKIRQSKLPDYRKIGNCGSFFKNAVIDKRVLKLLQTKYPDIPYYKVDNDKEKIVEKVKIPTAWLIEQTGWKGEQYGQAGVYKNHALVLVNLGFAKGHEVFDLSEKIINSVYEKFGIAIEREVNIV